ncbi:pyruvate carboxylase [Oceanidesulfovibrio indonesiensis]|uniref:pyruvate carboxylase n=1 Tax=Oceanidesulfovibrio indonesiensis TaxID=54767 RepID=A0A7M3MGA5_9BACT|nr:pyruvate carboxylase [Oceanidesulfovibrio indonesiensis]TVM18352.1 pyruvate carboxylase [Oceanidesulfovibrio indonesiensis]
MSIKSFQKVQEEIKGQPILVANRGIPARRILRSIYERFDAIPIMTATEVDKTSPSTSGAKELLLLGKDPRAYLDIELIIRKAKARGIVAIHPGWGFASENEDFPRLCDEAGIRFIGAWSEPMRKLGNKVALRQLAKELGVPVVPGSDGAVDIPEARRLAQEIGFPIMLKAEGGGGGRGIFAVHGEKELENAFEKASAMAKASFGNPRLFVEKMLTDIRHIEIQVIADKYGNVFAFDERDCSVQRNHQKLIEITPSPWPGMTPELRERLKEYSIRLVKAVDYYSLATVEFLVDGSGAPYLIEANTRLQVEHGITECRYGVDLVEEQIAIAFDGELRFNEEATKPLQHAMQVRINCEDPKKNFEPNSGVITRYISTGGPGVRLDSCIAAGYEFPSQYDSAGSLLITYGSTWNKTLAVMNRALREYFIGGIKTTIPFHRQVINHPVFQKGEYSTMFIAEHPEIYNYLDVESEATRLSRLVAEISAKGHNPYIKYGEYRTRETPRLPNFDMVLPRIESKEATPYPRGDRQAILDFVRDSGYVHFTDTTARDITQSNSGNRFRLAEDELMGPYLDNCRFFSLENGGGAHFHVAMLANMTYPFTEAKKWNEFAPKSLKQILIRSTNVLGYKPQPKNLMRLTGEMVNEHYDVIRCFDFLNHIENMRAFAEVVLDSRANIFEPAISLSWARGFDVDHYLGVTEEILRMVADVAGVNVTEASKRIILGLKDMAGMCPPRFIRALVEALRRKWPELVLHYHRHYTDGLFVPAVGAAAEAGAHIVDTAIGSTVRWYGQGDVLSTAAYIEDELGLKTNLNKGMIRQCNFVLKQIMPYYDRYTAPYFQGIDYDVVEHAMPGGATSSSQEGAMQQGYIHLLPYMLRFLAGTRKIVRYHDVTPGSQITWNTAFLAVTHAYQRGGEEEVLTLLDVLEGVVNNPDQKIDPDGNAPALMIYQDSNDAFRDLLLGKYGRLPLGFPPDWVYRSAFGRDYKKALAARTELSPLEFLEDMDLEAEREALRSHLQREPSEEEFVIYLNHPGDALNTIRFHDEFGDPNQLPLDVWFEGAEVGHEVQFNDSDGKPHSMTILRISRPDDHGMSTVRYTLDHEILDHEVKVCEVETMMDGGVEMADSSNPYHIGSPGSGDLWVMYVSPGDLVKKGEEIFNISIMKQEKAVLAPVDGRVKRVIKTAKYSEDRQMVPVKGGELIVELEPAPITCPTCDKPLMDVACRYCAHCGERLGEEAAL